METTIISPELALEPGIFAKTFQRDSVDEVFDAIANHGLTCTQWNWTCVRGLSSLPEAVSRETARAVNRAAFRTGIRIVAVSATFNIIDPVERERGLARLPALAEAAVAVGCDLLTLCTGTRHPTDMWAWHPDNHTQAAWTDMIDALRRASRIAHRYGVCLGIEPETANIISDAAHATLAFHELRLDSLPFSIVLDAANLYQPPADPRRHPEVIDDAVSRLGDYITIAHAKDIAAPQEPHGALPSHYRHVAAGTGILPYPQYLASLLKSPAVQDEVKSGGRLPLVLHGLDETQVSKSVAFLRESMKAAVLA